MAKASIDAGRQRLKRRAIQRGVLDHRQTSAYTWPKRSTHAGRLKSCRTRSWALAARARRYGANVIEIYSPNATWARVLSATRGALAETARKALADLIASLGPLPPISDLSASQMLEAIRHDKKVVAGTLHFVLPTAIGAWAIVDDVTEKEIKAALLKLGFRK